MTPADTFWAVFAAVLGAVILGGTFFWGMATYSRLEKNGGTKSDEAMTALIAIIMPLAVLGIGAFITLYPAQ